MKLNELPAVWAVGVPVLPVAVPGAAVSPGINTCNLVAVPAVTNVLVPVFAVNVAAWSVAVTVWFPAVRKETVNVPVPAVNAALDGCVSLASLVVMATVGVDDVTLFHHASTALTVTVVLDPAT
ncbi:hypothetical protein AQAU111925_10595 [Aquirufa aurantiipilula]